MDKIIHGWLEMWNFSLSVELDISLVFWQRSLVRYWAELSKKNSISMHTHMCYSLLIIISKTHPLPFIFMISVKCPPDCQSIMFPSSSADTIRWSCDSSSQIAPLWELRVSWSLTAVPREGISKTMIFPSDVPVKGQIEGLHMEN